VIIEGTYILDPAQLKRIEGVHRGFLYQHFYAAGCLLLASISQFTSLFVETDEDIEFLNREHHVYVQVKTRSEPLGKFDIKGSLSRFDELRKAHHDKQRKLSPQFYVVSNITPGPELLRDLSSPDWPKDISIIWPGCSQVNPMIPPAWPNLPDALKWCVEKAQSVPFSRLPGETLVWKLAAIIQFACTGSSSRYYYHEFRADDLPDVFEQMVLQLQDFPKSPAPYRPQQSEPSLTSEAAVRLIIGLSGAGKTSWASQLAMHNSDTMAYYDISDVSDQNIASSLTRELAARFLGNVRDGISTVLLPGMTGLDSLRALGKLLRVRDIQATVIIDNIHRIASDQIRSIIQATPTLNYVLLSRPWTGQQEIEALFNLHAEVLDGWTADTIAAEFADNGCILDPEISSRVLKLTGGLPLYVRNAASLTKERYEGATRRFCEVIESKHNITPLAQELILAQVVDEIKPIAKDAMALMSLTDVPLTVPESFSLLCNPLNIDEENAHQILRDLSQFGIVQFLKDDRVLIHDAFRLAAGKHKNQLSEATLKVANLALRNILEDSIKTKHDVSRISLFLRLLPITGEIASLIDLAGNEFFIELGFEREFRSVLENACSNEELTPVDRFWAMDALAFWDLQKGDYKSVAVRLPQMEGLLLKIENGKKETLALSMKKMLLSSKQGDLPTAKAIFSEAYKLFDEELYRRILRYNFAVILYDASSFPEAAKEAYELAMEYYEILNLSLEDVLAKNPEEVLAKIADIGDQQDDLKHLADSLDLYAKAFNDQGKYAGLARLHAHKFYVIANAVKSAVRVGQDVVDEQLSLLHDAIAARQFMEKSLLPVIQHYKLFDYVVPVRAQYAVVLAYCGEIEKANAEMSSLIPFIDALPDVRQKEFENQRELIKKIHQGAVTLGPKSPLQKRFENAPVPIYGKRKIGRNELCPCGSGKKYKKCCGR